MNRTHNTSETPLKDQTSQAWSLAYNPSNLGGKNQEGYGLRLAQVTRDFMSTSDWALHLSSQLCRGTQIII
jgi:hypothetical protein